MLERRVVFHPDTEQHHLRVAVALDRQELVEAGRAFATDMLPYLLGLGVILMIAAWVQVRIGLAPLDAVRLGVRSIRRGEPGACPRTSPTK